MRRPVAANHQTAEGDLPTAALVVAEGGDGRLVAGGEERAVSAVQCVPRRRRRRRQSDRRANGAWCEASKQPVSQSVPSKVPRKRRDAPRAPPVGQRASWSSIDGLSLLPAPTATRRIDEFQGTASTRLHQLPRRVARLCVRSLRRPAAASVHQLRNAVVASLLARRQKQTIAPANAHSSNVPHYDPLPVFNFTQPLLAPIALLTSMRPAPWPYYVINRRSLFFFFFFSHLHH
uniref:Uncharacterized protein n=1 Tax=Plectus sambesii TaxID=2011161 RepID=A0A914VL22_9BILA